MDCIVIKYFLENDEKNAKFIEISSIFGIVISCACDKKGKRLKNAPFTNYNEDFETVVMKFLQNLKKNDVRMSYRIVKGWSI